MKHLTRCAILLLLSGTLVGFSGCTGTTKPSSFYLLSTMPASQPQATSQTSGPSILIGPVTLPAYLDRAQMVTRKTNSELTIDEFNRWAEPLRDSLYRVLKENLSALLNTADVTVHTQRNAAPVDYQIVIDFTRFDGDEDGNAWLVAYWSLLSDDGDRLLGRNKTVIQTTPASMDYGARVAAQNQLLKKFSRELADAVSEAQAGR